MFNVGTGELILIAVVALLVLGPKRLPELARGIGKFMREFRRQTDDVRNVVEREFYRMDQEINTDGPKLQPPPEAVPLQPPPEAVPPPEVQQPAPEAFHPDEKPAEGAAPPEHPSTPA